MCEIKSYYDYYLYKQLNRYLPNSSSDSDSDSEIFIRHLNHTIQLNAIKNNTNRKKHVGRLPLRHCYVASMGATKLDT